MGDVTRSLALFIAWVAVGFIGSFALLYGFTVFGPPILLAVWLAYRYLPKVGASRMPEGLGALGGFGAFLIFLSTTIDGDASIVALVGAMTLGASAVAYLALGCHRCRQGLAA